MKLKSGLKSLTLISFKKIGKMDILAEKEQLKLELDKVQDIHLIEAIKSLLAYGKYQRYEKALQPLTEEAFYARNSISQQQILENNLVNDIDVKAYFSRKDG